MSRYKSTPDSSKFMAKSSKNSPSSPVVKSGGRTPNNLKSPASPSRQVLTGSRRVLNDTIVNIHSTIQAWNSLLLKGLMIIQEVQKNRANEDTVQKNCEKLGVIVRQMKNGATKLGQYTEQLTSLAALNVSSSPPFLTWNYDDFSSVAKEIHASYQAETEVKIEIAYNLHKCRPEQLAFCIVAWTQVIYVLDKDKLEDMLVECDLRK